MVFGLFVDTARDILSGENVLDSLTNNVSQPAKAVGMLVGGGVRSLPKPLQVASQLGLSHITQTPQAWSDGFNIIDSVTDKLPTPLGELASSYIDNIDIMGVKVGTGRKITELGYRPFQKGYREEFSRENDDPMNESLVERAIETGAEGVQNIAYEGYRQATPQQRRLLQQALDEIWN